MSISPENSPTSKSIPSIEVANITVDIVDINAEKSNWKNLLLNFDPFDSTQILKSEWSKLLKKEHLLHLFPDDPYLLTQKILEINEKFNREN